MLDTQLEDSHTVAVFATGCLKYKRESALQMQAYLRWFDSPTSDCPCGPPVDSETGYHCHNSDLRGMHSNACWPGLTFAAHVAAMSHPKSAIEKCVQVKMQNLNQAIERLWQAIQLLLELWQAYHSRNLCRGGTAPP